MLKVNRQLPTFRITKNGPKGVSPVEQKLYRMGYRMFGEKLVDVKISNKKSQVMRLRSYFRGKQCIKVGDIVSNIPNVAVNG